MNIKTEYRSFNIFMPEPLIPIYDFLQGELNSILSDDSCREKLSKIDLKKHKGNVWRDMRDFFKGRLKNWPINNKTWYSYILYENLRRELQSKKENTIIWDEYVLNNKSINFELFENLVSKHKIYATRGRIESIVSANTRPELAREAVFQLDYTISEKQMFRVSKYSPYLFEIKVGNKPTDWIGYCIKIPDTIRPSFTGKIAKPRFMKRKSDGKYIGICSYEVLIEEKEKTNRVLGLDIGKVNPYLGVVIDDGLIVSSQLLPSNKLYKLSDKLNVLKKEKDLLYEKNIRFSKYGVKSLKNSRRESHYKAIRSKISNLTTYIASQIAFEVVALAEEYKCSEIHVENLSWLKSTGGKWNHSEVLEKIEEVAALKGIKLVKVSAYNSSKEHPISGEVGKDSNRDIVFLDGEYIDRDLLASINLALRDKNKKQKRDLKKLKVPQMSKTKPNKYKNKEKVDLINKNRANEIVLVQPYQADFTDKLSNLAIRFAIWKSLTAQVIYTSCINKHKDVSIGYTYDYLLQV